jgi:hypothetical protein
MVGLGVKLRLSAPKLTRIRQKIAPWLLTKSLD